MTRHYGDPARGVHALQLEIAQACYMDEAPPYPWDERRAAPLVDVLERLVVALLAMAGLIAMFRFYIARSASTPICSPTG